MAGTALLLTDDDFRSLRDDPASIDGPLQAVELSTIAAYRGRSRQTAMADDVKAPDGLNSLRVSLAAGEDMNSGLRVFGNAPNTRLYLLFDGESRNLLALMDYGVLNSLRVAAIAGLAAQRLTQPGATTMGMIGSGWQARTQAQVMRRVLPGLQRILVYSPTAANRERFAREMTAWLGIDVVAVGSKEEAVGPADLVSLVAPGHYDVREPLLEFDWVKPGACIISTAGQQSTEAFIRRCRIVVPTWQAMLEDPSTRPPYTAMIREGRWGKDDVVELGAVLTGDQAARQSPSDVVIYELTPVYVHDLWVATWGLEWAKARGLGVPFKLSDYAKG